LSACVSSSPAEQASQGQQTEQFDFAHVSPR
jgi:hypothetical protein